MNPTSTAPRNRRFPARRAIALTGAFATVTTIGLLGGAAAADPPAKEPSLTGAGQIHYRYSPHDDIRFAFDVHGNTIGARGTFSYSHEIGGVTFRTEADVDCLVTGGRTATVTGVITSTDVPEHLGMRVGVTVEDLGRRDRLGFSWGVSEIPTPRCLGTAPFTEVIDGNYVVQDGPFTIPGEEPPAPG